MVEGTAGDAVKVFFSYLVEADLLQHSGARVIAYRDDCSEGDRYAMCQVPVHEGL